MDLEVPRTDQELPWPGLEGRGWVDVVREISQALRYFPYLPDNPYARNPQALAPCDFYEYKIDSSMS